MIIKRKTLTDEWKRKISESHKGEKNHFFGKKHTPETLKKISETGKGRIFSDERNKKIGDFHRGRKRSQETIRKLKEANTGEKNPMYGKKGEKSGNWRGGVSLKEKLIRGSFEYKLWRIAVFERDKYTCVWCGDNKGGNLNADHIKPFASYPELRFAIDNGRTLCVKCHMTTSTWGRPTKIKC